VLCSYAYLFVVCYLCIFLLFPCCVCSWPFGCCASVFKQRTELLLLLLLLLTHILGYYLCSRCVLERYIFLFSATLPANMIFIPYGEIYKNIFTINTLSFCTFIPVCFNEGGHAVLQLFKAQRYTLEGRGFDS
jgi:hypothetical protein